jgi:5-methylcytosine-specific restriction endonuclease McrA
MSPIVRACLGSGSQRCGRLIRPNRTRCPACTTLHNRATARPAWVSNVYGSHAWRTLADRVVAEADGCHWCGATDVPLSADHVLRLRAHPELAVEPGNVVAACRSCQRRRQVRR